jgi:hypothetical protein
VIELKGKATHSSSQVSSELISQWLTPGGEIITGSDITYTVKEADVVDGGIGDFVFKAWVPGLETQTTAQATVSLDVWSYEMPDVGLALMSNILIAPATIAARVDTAYFYAPGVELEYEWILPESVVVDRQTTSLTYLKATKPGVQQIGVRVLDNRGNSKEVFEFIDVVQADAMQTGLEIKASNSFMRAPVMITAKSNAVAGHPDDKIEKYDWSVNGQANESLTRYYANIELNEPGTYTIAVDFTSKFGQTGAQEQTVEVVPNTPAVCEPYWKEDSSSITAYANCRDDDGKIIGITYQWREDGYVSSGGTRLRFTKSLHDSIKLIIRATDDSGAETVSQIEWNKS